MRTEVGARVGGARRDATCDFRGQPLLDELRTGGGDREGVRPFAGSAPLEAASRFSASASVACTPSRAAAASSSARCTRRRRSWRCAVRYSAVPFSGKSWPSRFASVRKWVTVSSSVLFLISSSGDVRDDGVAASPAARGRGYGGAGEQESGPGEHGAKVPERRGRQAAWHPRRVRQVVLIVNPFASGVTRRARRGGRARARVGRGGADAPDRAAGPRGRAVGGSVRRRRRRDRGLLRRRGLQRGRERRRRPRPARLRARRRDERARARARAAAGARRGGARARGRDRRGRSRGSRSGASTGAASRSRPGSASTPSSCGGSTRSGAREDGHRPGDLAFAGGPASSCSSGAHASSRCSRCRASAARRSLSSRTATRSPTRAACRSGDARGALRARARPRRAAHGPPADVPRLLAYLATGRAVASRGHVAYAHDLDRIEIVCDRPLPLQADGEDLGDVERRRARGRARGAPRARRRAQSRRGAGESARRRPRRAGGRDRPRRARAAGARRARRAEPRLGRRRLRAARAGCRSRSGTPSSRCSGSSSWSASWSRSGCTGGSGASAARAATRSGCTRSRRSSSSPR